MSMTKATVGGTAETPQAPAQTSAVAGELVDAAHWPRRIRPHEWQDIQQIVELLTRHKGGRVVCDLYEISRDDYGCIHATFGQPGGE